MQESTVKAIINPAISSGFNKNGKPYSQALVELANGVSTRIFTPVNIGDAVESVQNGTYTNWIIKKGGSPAAGPANTEVMSALRQVYSLLDTVNKKVDTLMYGDDTSKTQPPDAADEPIDVQAFFGNNGVPF